MLSGSSLVYSILFSAGYNDSATGVAGTGLQWITGQGKAKKDGDAKDDDKAKDEKVER